MPTKVTILERIASSFVPSEGPALPSVAVTFTTDEIPVRTIHVRRDLYRPATPEELQEEPRYSYLPTTDDNRKRESELIGEDIKVRKQRAPETFELE